jgi:hypothetical protein
MNMRFSVGPKPTTPRSHYRVDEHGDKYMKQGIVAFEGKCIVTASADDFFGGSASKDYRSRVLENPTWGQLFSCAKAQQKKTLDYHHGFFENYYTHGTANVKGEDVTILKLSLGS